MAKRPGYEVAASGRDGEVNKTEKIALNNGKGKNMFTTYSPTQTKARHLFFFIKLNWDHWGTE